ncbi:MAG TPA: zeta toxin family protein [Pyrinomonadaceae bacterium]|nr:zeta toxin family protein [Pyrinomonadaceae bacterium]
MPNVVVIAGPNGAGKSTLAPALLRDTLNILEYVNADTIAEGLSAFAPEDASFDAGRVMLQRLNELARKRRSLAFETTLASRFYANWIKGLQRSGYRFTLMFLWLENAELAKERVKERVRLGGHNIPTETIVRRYERGLKNLFDLYLPIANTWSVRDTSAAKSVEIARYTDEEGERVFDEALWNQIKK